MKYKWWNWASGFHSIRLIHPGRDYVFDYVQLCPTELYPIESSRVQSNQSDDKASCGLLFIAFNAVFQWDRDLLSEL